MAIDWYLFISQAGASKEGARERFEQLVAQLVGIRNKTVRRVQANPGDWGIDAFVGSLARGQVSVWQAKFFIDGFTKSQQKDVRESLTSALDAATKHGHRLTTWTLVIPVSMDGPMTKWWDGWTKREQKKHGIVIDLWDVTRIETYLLSPDAGTLHERYFTAGASPTTPPVHHPPEGEEFEHLLFMKQMREAGIPEVDGAKRDFFNAEILSREIADKGVDEEVAALDGMREELHALWEHRFTDRCSPEADNPKLPGFYSDVMRAVEALHNGKSPAVPLTLVHRFGTMHQVVEAGRAGWVVAWRELAKTHAEEGRT